MSDNRRHFPITIGARLETLQRVLDLVEDPEGSYPSQEDAQDFFELHWDLVEELAERAKEIGLTPSHEEEDEDGEELESPNAPGPE